LDIEGIYGELLACVRNANPNVSGILFDLPHAAPGDKRHIEQADLGPRCEFVAGDFFEYVPIVGDAYLLKSVIHDWDYKNSGRILLNCQAAMVKEGSLLLLEQMLPDRMETSASNRSIARIDLTMLVTLAARERTESEFRSLPHTAGFRIGKIVPVGPTYSLIQALPLP
jgi:hypothetical protein